MKQLLHNIRIRVFEKNPDEIDKIHHVFEKLLPIDFKKEKITVSTEEAEGFDEKTIYILTLKTEKRRHNWLLLETVFKKMSDADKQKIYRQRDSRLDDQGNFFLRLDKPSLLEGEFQLVEHGDCFHFKIKIAAFPSNREKLMNSLETVLEKIGCSPLE